MKAVLFREHGGPDKLLYEEVPMPVVAQEDVLIKVKACALNHLDIWIRQGNPAYPMPLPHISGSDIAGVVEEVGSQVDGVKAGERVLVSPGLSCWRCEYCLAGQDNFCRTYSIIGAIRDGGYAEYVSVPFRNVLPMPDNLTFEQAASFPLVSVTASHMLFALAGLQHGETVLVMGAGSGVGSMAVQMAKLAGARVITTVGSDDKIPKAVLLGADAVINHAKEHVAERVRLLTEGKGVDVVVEHIGPDVWDLSLQALSKGGRLITCGATTGAEVKLDLRYVFSRQLTIKGSYMGTRAELVKAAELMGQRRLKPVIDRTFPLAEARAAQELMLSRKFFGKIVLVC
ncbi:zinc-binding dehydrogenase [Candidatus Nitrospira inopinata]|jgi:NADPH:quinone reductase-like Zn-dependent oxidoreductase|uniref:Putative NAD-dependent alcohol dehydrogenase n=1 Tax=Candidatus Nitrospira inopinata TaxID=1715989 RepID=A0A0S4KXH7_9BACT|nr:zinc-binding dehydrogenase [Candidatus Nitrospira inopinata]CUQ67880.1 putative NAD-dependent alcohol dehydrogenase [Candidatus Nitrospira inopinata]